MPVRRPVLLAAAAALLAPLLVAAPASSAAPDVDPAAVPASVQTSAARPAAEASGVRVAAHRVTTSDGVRLSAVVLTPTGHGDGPHPLVLAPSSWALNSLEYVGGGARLAAERGVVVVSYTSRGFWESGGQIQVAGPRDVQDASELIDWAVATQGADAERVGMVGISYGAGISLLTAAADDRVDAVAAMSGWADLEASLLPNGTISEQAAALLLTSALFTGRAGPELRAAQRAYLTGDFAPVLEFAPSRSAATKVDRLNAHGTAVLIAHAWTDGIFPPSQMVDLYGALTGPKRLEIAPGDHATAELPGAVGLPDETWDSVGRWVGEHVVGEATGIDDEPPVRLRTANTGAWTSYADWESATTSTEALDLGPHVRTWRNPLPTGDAVVGAPGGWTRTVAARRYTVADSGTVLVSGVLQGLGLPTTASVPLVDRSGAMVWYTARQASTTTVQGAPRVRFDVAPQASTTTLFAYLYDVDAFGTGSLMTHKALTVGAGTTEVDLELEPTSWRVAAGHHVVLVVDGVDPRYRSTSVAGTTVTVTPGTDPALELPRG